ncbi:MAG: hypothetical protein J0L75_06030 [Spirochaetes bacterium]|nr:hypothetical protein [Spirochaetota bacterium]
MTRRRFVAIGGMGAAALLLSLKAADTKKKSRPATEGLVLAGAPGHFSLRPISDRVQEASSLPGKGILEGEWGLEFMQVRAVPSRNPQQMLRTVPTGTLRLGLRGGERRSLLEFRQGGHRIELVIAGGSAGLSGWTDTASSALGAGETLRRVQEIRLEGEVALLKTISGAMGFSDVLPCPGPLWCLADLLVLLARGRKPEGSFTFLDENGNLGQNQRLGDAGEIPWGAGSLRGYYQVGDATHPIHYWFDAAGRPLFITHAMRSYLLQKVEA